MVSSGAEQLKTYKEANVPFSYYEPKDAFLDRMVNDLPNVLYVANNAEKPAYCSDADEALRMISQSAKEASPTSAVELFNRCAAYQKPFVASEQDVQRLSFLQGMTADETREFLAQSGHRIVQSNIDRVFADASYSAVPFTTFQRLSAIKEGSLDEEYTTMYQGQLHQPARRQKYMEYDSASNGPNFNQVLGMLEENQPLAIHGINDALRNKVSDILKELNLTQYAENPKLLKSLPVREQKQIAQSVCDYIVKNTSYDPVVQSYTQGENAIAGASPLLSAYATLCHGREVCNGYANAANYIYRELGFDSQTLTQRGDGPIGHAAVLLNIGGEPYVVDPTVRISERERTEFNGKKQPSMKASEVYAIPKYADVVREHSYSGQMAFYLDQNKMEQDFPHEEVKETYERVVEKDKTLGEKVRSPYVSANHVGSDIVFKQSNFRKAFPSMDGDDAVDFSKALTKAKSEKPLSGSNYLRQIATNCGIYDKNGEQRAKNAFDAYDIAATNFEYSAAGKKQRDARIAAKRILNRQPPR